MKLLSLYPNRGEFYETHKPDAGGRRLFPSSNCDRIPFYGDFQAKRTRLAWRDRGLLTFMRVLFVGWRYQHIYISTGPDGEHYTDIVNVLFFFLCCLFYGHKITMTLRNTKPYLESDPGIYSFIRSRAIRHVRRFTFETATMRDIFIALTERRNVLSGVSYDKYPDVPIDGVEVAPQPDVSGKTRIGLLGSVNAERRDYEFVAAALERLTDDERKSICLATIGQCDGGAQHPEMLKISRFAEVDCRDGLLSEIELIERGVPARYFWRPSDLTALSALFTDPDLSVTRYSCAGH